MNREIKFRLIKNGKIVGYMALMPICCKGKRLIWKYSENGKDGWRGAGNAVIDFDRAEAYTGLKDKNGTEIYEGSVVRLTQEPQWSKVGQVPPTEDFIVEWVANEVSFQFDHTSSLCNLGGHRYIPLLLLMGNGVIVGTIHDKATQ